MLQESYSTEANEDFITFEFDSVGPQGRVRKVVQYTLIAPDDVLYNLGFGDLDPRTGELDDLAVTDNADARKVLLTVATTLYAFFDHYPDALVVAAGSTPSRTRLYRIGIARNWSLIEQNFVVLGSLGQEWEPFQPDMNYQAFLVYCKSLAL